MFDRLADLAARWRETPRGADKPDSVPPAEAPAPQPGRPKLVELVVYAEDCVLAGQIPLTADRLSDMLNDGDRFELSGVRVDDLAGGNAWEIRAVELARDEMLLVHASGPRGNPGRRHRTRQQPIVAKAGPYEVRGYVHSFPGTDAIASLRRRQPMIALTDAVIEYAVQSRRQERRAGVLILNRDLTDWVVEGHDAEIVMPEMPVDTTGALLKDFTGDLLDVETDWNF